MKNELKNRREFFKEAAKKTLPILGMAIMAVAAPTMMQSCKKEVTCGNNCSGSCKGSCSGGCQYSCSGRCHRQCGYGCSGTSR